MGAIRKTFRSSEIMAQILSVVQKYNEAQSQNRHDDAETLRLKINALADELKAELVKERSKKENMAH
jgi:hypothetical protein